MLVNPVVLSVSLFPLSVVLIQSLIYELRTKPELVATSQEKN